MAELLSTMLCAVCLVIRAGSLRWIGFTCQAVFEAFMDGCREMLLELSGGFRFRSYNQVQRVHVCGNDIFQFTL